MKYINGITFGPFAPKDSFKTAAAKESLLLMKERTGADFVIFVPQGLQEHSYSENIDFGSRWTLGDEELSDMIAYAKSIGLRVALKPTVNCKDKTWRAFINFFDNDVHCEPKWSNWFRSHTAFQLHFARIAEKSGCEMFIAGCEMVMTQRREAEWRKLISDIKSVYSGLVSYNTDKYQEDQIAWWDCVDVISSSGYYPTSDWEKELDRIEKVVDKFNKPFFFAETGCMSATGSSKVPNDWSLAGDINLEEQADWYKSMFSAASKRKWMQGYGLWAWGWKQYHIGDSDKDKDYDIYGKPAEAIVREYFMKNNEG